MKTRLTIASLLGAIALTSSADAATLPGVSRPVAEEMTGRLLRNEYTSWNRRQFGYIDCLRGKINRTQWSCGVGWVTNDNRCYQGRVRIVGTGYSAAGDGLYSSYGAVKRVC